MVYRNNVNEFLVDDIENGGGKYFQNKRLHSELF